MIVVSYGSDIARSTYDAVLASDMASYLKPGVAVAIKPNLVVSGPASLGATTHPEVVEGIILYLRELGIRDIKIIESSWVGDDTARAFQVCGYEALSRKHGVALVDLKSDSFTLCRHEGSGIEVQVCDEALNTGFLINVPVLKAHCQTKFTCCMKNLKGCIPDSEKRRFHRIGLHKPIAVLSALIPVGYCVVDGICGDLTMEEGGNPVISNRIIAGRDPMLVDSFCAGLIGYRAEEIEHIAYGRAFGLGEYYTDSTEIKEINAQRDISLAGKGGKQWKAVRGSGFAAARYSKHIVDDAACSACYSALIYALHRCGGKVSTEAKVHIGQGFREKSGAGVGVGDCAAGFEKNVPGCPPKALDIVEALGTG